MLSVVVTKKTRALLTAKLIKHRGELDKLATKVTRVIETHYGKVLGRQRTTLYEDKLYYAFEGIPYAKPPLGELRFRAPEQPESWNGILDCTFTKSIPCQDHFIFQVVGTEDCLHLNVYTKNLNMEKPMPVLVWLHGGGFQNGEASKDWYSPDYFMQKNVVLITLNYRLGALGFLSLSDPDLDVPGNAGIKDQVMALQWIYDNIDVFNGDPANVTVIGMEAGAVSAQVMMTTEQTRDLFHKVILMSGSSLCGWAFRSPSNSAYRLARKLGFTGNMDNESDILAHLQKMPAKKLVSGSKMLTQAEERNYLLFPFVPVVEPYLTQSCVISSPPLQSIPKAWGNSLPLIIGGTSCEGLIYQQFVARDAQFLQKNFTNLIPKDVRDESDPTEMSQHLRRLKMVFFEDSTISKMSSDDCLRLLTITQFWHPIRRTLLARLAYASKSPTYLYRFDIDSLNFNHYRNIACHTGTRGACHGDDCYYLFYGNPAEKVETFSREYRVIKRMIAMWTAFALNGDPNCESIHPTKWEPICKKNDSMCLNIGKLFEFIELPDRKILQVWDSFYKHVKLF